MSLGFPGGSVVKSHLPMQWTQRSLGREEPLEEGMATPSSVLAWRISMVRGAWWARAGQSLVGHESMGSQRVRHDWATKQQQMSLENRHIQHHS